MQFSELHKIYGIPITCFLQRQNSKLNTSQCTLAKSVHGTRNPIWVPPQSWINLSPGSYVLAPDWLAREGTDWIDSGGDQVR